jgi:hypothetical protein
MPKRRGNSELAGEGARGADLMIAPPGCLAGLFVPVFMLYFRRVKRPRLFLLSLAAVGNFLLTGFTLLAAVGH